MTSESSQEDRITEIKSVRGHIIKEMVLNWSFGKDGQRRAREKSEKLIK